MPVWRNGQWSLWLCGWWLSRRLTELLCDRPDRLGERSAAVGERTEITKPARAVDGEDRAGTVVGVVLGRKRLAAEQADLLTADNSDPDTSRERQSTEQPNGTDQTATPAPLSSTSAPTS